MDLTEFLAARLDEDEDYLRTIKAVGEEGAANATPEDLADVAAVALGVLSDPRAYRLLERWGDDAHLPAQPPNDLSRLLCELAAKRAILGMWSERVPSPWILGRHMTLKPVLRHFAAIYSDHPDYDPAWKVT